jgi:hypothetical protein
MSQLIAKQVDDKGLVVWYDPERACASAAAELSVPDTMCIRYGGGFIALRKAVDDRLNDTQPPRLVVYVPIERTETHSALIGLDCAGVVMQPRQQPPACNTRLSVVARNALKPILGEEQVGEIERQVESGKLSLADLDALAAQGIEISTSVLKLIFGPANPKDVALAFLHSDRQDDEVDEKQAQKSLRHLTHLAFDIEIPAGEPLSTLRARLARHQLLTDLFAALKTQTPAALPSVSVAESPGASMPVCVWRTPRDTVASIAIAPCPWPIGSRKSLDLARWFGPRAARRTRICRHDGTQGEDGRRTAIGHQRLTRRGHRCAEQPRGVRRRDRLGGHGRFRTEETIGRGRAGRPRRPEHPSQHQGSALACRTAAGGMDNGARRALVPLENKRNVLDVSGEIVERVDPVFFSDPMTAATKGLGIELSPDGSTVPRFSPTIERGNPEH